MPLYQAHVTLPVLLQAPDRAAAERALDCRTMESILQEAEDGDFLAGAPVYAVAPVRAADAVTRQEEFGNDGTFFELDADETDDLSPPLTQDETGRLAALWAAAPPFNVVLAMAETFGVEHAVAVLERAAAMKQADS